MLIASSKRIVVVGLGVTGLSVARYLRDRKQFFSVMDSRTEPPGLAEFQKEFPDVSVHLGSLNQDILRSASQIVLSPGLSLKTPEIASAIKMGVEVVGDVELFARELELKKETAVVIAITGSNAKTTVTALVGEMAKNDGKKVAVGGNIGTPVLDLLTKEMDVYVLELSSFQLETTRSLSPKVATILNISQDHMDRYNSLMAYHQAKQRIYMGASTVVVNRADALTKPPLSENVRCLSFGLDEPDRNGFGIRAKSGRAMISHEFVALLPADKLSIRGQHNVANCIAALAIGYAANFSISSMMKTMQNFTGLPHRCQLIATINGVDYINDSKATNVGATMAALSGFAIEKTVESEKKIILIAGGQAKGADFLPLKEIIASEVVLLIVIGCDAPILIDVFGGSVEIDAAENLNQAVAIAKAKAHSGDVVLLSPACASFDMFSGYEERGNQFIRAVEAIPA